MMEDDVTKHESMEPLSGEEANSGRDGTFGDNEEATVFQTTEVMEEVARALALIAGPRRDDQKAKGLEAGEQDGGMMAGQGILMAESIAVDGSQQVRGADDVRVSNVQGVQGFRSMVLDVAAEDVGAIVGTGSEAAIEEDDYPSNWKNMSKSQRKNWIAARKRIKQRESM